MTPSNAKPASTIRDGNLKATIWANFGEKGTFYSVVISRTYQDEQGNYCESESFSNGQLLRLARLANIAYDEIQDLRKNDKAQVKRGES